MKKTIILALALAVGASFGLMGCKKKDKKAGAGGGAFSCENMSKKMSKCSTEIVAEMMKSMPAALPKDQKDKIAEKMKAEFTGPKMVEQCKKEMAKNDPKDKAEFEKMKGCFSKGSCGDFAACFGKAMGK